MTAAWVLILLAAGYQPVPIFTADACKAAILEIERASPGLHAVCVLRGVVP